MDSRRDYRGKKVGSKTILNLLIFGVGTLFSRFFGFLREVFLAYSLGATHLSDVFYASFRIVNLLRILFGEGVMHVSLVPLLIENRKDVSRYRKFLDSTFTFFFSISLFFTLLGIFLSPLLILIFAPGFKNVSFKFIYAKDTLMMMFPFVFFIILAGYFGSILNSEKNFFPPSFAPFFFNFFFLLIGCVSYFFLNLNEKFFLISLAIAIVVGGLFEALFQFFFVIKKIKISITKNLFIPEIKDFFRLLIPVFVTVLTNEIIIIITTFLASFLPEGELSYLSYSFRLRHFPIAILGIGLATVSLPYMTESDKKIDYLKRIYKFSLSILFPLVLLLIIHSDFIIKIFFERGKFKSIDTLKTSLCFIWFSLGILPASLFNVHLNYFYSQKKILEVNISHLYMLSSFLFFAPLLFKLMGYTGLALSSSISSFVALVTICFYTPKFIDFKDYKEFILIALIFTIIVSVKFFTFSFLEFLIDSLLSLIFFIYFRKRWKLKEI
ncbi:MAG: murein biosynthesis integral membrane protein MurJ [Candidatus Hydrothermales bacterium]